MAKKPNFNPVREEIMNSVAENLLADFEVLRVASQEFSIPVVDADGNEGYVAITFRIPKGSRDGTPYDGHAEAEDYKFKQAEKAKKQAEKEREKQAKIAADEKKRQEAKKED